MRLIDADALIETITANAYPIRYDENSTEEGMTISGIRRAIEEQPTARKKGKWVEDKYAYNSCSICGYEWDTPEYDTAPFCPQCGAEMERKSKDEDGGNSK